MDKKERELVFGAITAAIALMLIYALNLFGTRSFGIWIGAIAVFGYAAGYFLLEEASKVAGGNGSTLLGIMALCAFLAIYLSFGAGSAVNGLYPVFLVFALVFGAGKVARSLLIGRGEEDAQPNKA